MDKFGEVLLILRIMSELGALLRRAFRGDAPITRKDIALAFSAADAAEAKWREANEEAAASERGSNG